LSATTLVGPLLDRVRLRDEPLRCRPVRVSILDRPAGPGWLAVGDAASERDPITGCGIHDALLDAADATWTIAAAVGERESPPWRYQDRSGDPAQPRRLARRRRRAPVVGTELSDSRPCAERGGRRRSSLR
jgi:flavin-dependent dehydrogenase